MLPFLLLLMIALPVIILTSITPSAPDAEALPGRELSELLPSMPAVPPVLATGDAEVPTQVRSTTATGLRLPCCRRCLLHSA